MVAFNAVYNAVAGMLAQSHALENISGNIANARTNGYKRIDSSFSDMVGASTATARGIAAGAVGAYSRASTTIRGEIMASGAATNMAIKGNEFFVGRTADGQAVYTRRGDFSLDGEGYLTNGAGTRLGSGTGFIQVDRAEILPPKKSTTVDYQINLPSTPMPKAYDPKAPASGLLPPTSPARTLVRVPYGLSGDTPVGAADVVTGDELTLSFGDKTQRFVFNTGAGTMPPLLPGDIEVDASGTHDQMLAQVEAEMKARYPEAEGSKLYIDDQKNLVLELAGDWSDELRLAANFGSVIIDEGGTTVAAVFGDITADQEARFVDQSIPGGVVTVYAEDGTSQNLEMRWGKTSSEPGNETWALYYLSDQRAKGNEPMWVKAGEYSFTEQGKLSSIRNATGETLAGKGALPMTGVTINGTAYGDLTLDHGTNGPTQYWSTSGQVGTSVLKQDGYGEGKFLEVQTTDSGQVIALFDNGQTKEAGQVELVRFASADSLRRADNGEYFWTEAAGQVTSVKRVEIVAGAVEGSNADIPQEFEKLILTQQAYSANTQVASIANDMIGKAMDELR